MAPFPPILQDRYTDGQRAYIAGFLIWYRSTFLTALETMADPAVEQIPDWAEAVRRWYKDAESVTRYLLYELGYPVTKDEVWPSDNPPKP